MWAEFLITSLIVVIAPGTGVIYTIGIGLARGAKASIVAAAGCTCGIIPHMAAAIVGLAAILHTSAVLFQSFKWAGIVYLLYLAWSMLRDEGAIQFKAECKVCTLYKVATTGFFINILNPKLSIFFLAFLPQFVPTDASASFQRMLVLTGAFMAMTFAVFICYGILAAKIRFYVQHKPSIITLLNRGFAAAFVLLAARLALDTTSGASQ